MAVAVAKSKATTTLMAMGMAVVKAMAVAKALAKAMATTAADRLFTEQRASILQDASKAAAQLAARRFSDVKVQKSVAYAHRFIQGSAASTSSLGRTRSASSRSAEVDETHSGHVIMS